MGAEFTDLTWDEMCDLMCGAPEEDIEDDNDKNENIKNNLKLKKERTKFNK